MKKVLLLSTLVTASLISCGKDDDKVEITVPATYEFTRDGVSTVSYSGQTARIDMATELVGALKSTASTEVQLLEMYRNQKADGSDANPYNGTALNTSTKSVKSKVAASKDFFSANTVAAASVKQDFEGWIAAFVSEKEAYDNNLAEAGQPGQIADGSSTRLVNGGGLEYIQAVNKGLIGALMVDQLCNNYLSPAVLDEGENVSQNDTGIVANGKPYTTMEHKWDEAYGYLFGKAADGASPLADLGNDSFLSKYLKRVDDDADFTGIAQDIYDAFKRGRAAIVAGEYDERDREVERLRELVSTVVGVRAVYYLQTGKRALEGGDWGGGFHDLSEGFGFVYSLQFTRQPYSSVPYLSATEVDGIIDVLTAGNGFWDITSETLDGLSDQIASRFAFSVAQAAE